MKFGMRKPSLKKSLSARTKGKAKQRLVFGIYSNNDDVEILSAFSV